MQKLERNIAMTFRVTEKERDMIRRRKAQTVIKNMRAYLLKMAIDGEVIRILGNISSNIIQIARRMNETGCIYGEDIAEIKKRQDKIHMQQHEILRRLDNALTTLQKRR